MKMKREHYSALSEGIHQTLARHPKLTREVYRKSGLSDKRFRWDCLYLSDIGDESSTVWICRALYPYLDDTHIDTALRRLLT